MKMKITALAFTAVLLAAGSALANPIQQDLRTFLNSRLVPKGAMLIVDITYRATNDEDSGFVGYWALDNYEKRVQVWRDPVNQNLYYALARYDGKWTTFAGALSPEHGVTEPAGGSGALHGGYFATFNATGFTSAFGNIGTFDLGGTQGDILKGAYGSGQVGNSPAAFNWLSTYFANVSNFGAGPPPTGELWGWTYRYEDQTWNNFYSGSSGDIVTKPEEANESKEVTESKERD